jgi:hypothetical protein
MVMTILCHGRAKSDNKNRATQRSIAVRPNEDAGLGSVTDLLAYLKNKRLTKRRSALILESLREFRGFEPAPIGNAPGVSSTRRTCPPQPVAWPQNGRKSLFELRPNQGRGRPIESKFSRR